MSKLNILILATQKNGGAGIASTNINKLLNDAGCNSMLIVKEDIYCTNKVDDVNSNFIKNVPTKLLSKIRNRIWKLYNRDVLDSLISRYAFHNIDESRQYARAKEIMRNIDCVPDIIFLHWVSGFVNSKTISDLQKITNAKIYWLMMDNAPLTGGCHFPWNCEEFHDECLDCPAISFKAKKYFAKNNLAYKKNILPRNLEIIACSEMDYRRAMKSSLFRNNAIHKVLLPVDNNNYRPLDKTQAKDVFCIDSRKRVILYGALSINNPRKGGRYFLEAITHLQNNILTNANPVVDWLILVIGIVDKDIFSKINIPIKFLGLVNEEQLINVYQAADVYVSTSVEDSGPFMINQSMMCGTPVVSFEIGVSLDLVQTSKTGYCARLKDSVDIAKGLKYILDLEEKDYNIMSQNCRRLGIEYCHPQKQVNKILKAFQGNLN
jgi:glycosyltransferase involved in cell wall biosynthesis